MTSYLRGGALAIPPSMVAPPGEKMIQLSYPNAPVSVVAGQMMDKSHSSPVNLGKRCQVCGEKASGNFFGALVCLPCKTFFIRCSSEEVSTFRCRVDFNCEVTGSRRSKCKYCRYRKCIAVGMARRERPEHVEAADGQQLCVVCHDVANGVHFGIVSCEGCKKFFRRGLQESESYICKQNGACVINPKTRNDCRYCRFQKCLMAGMSRDAIKMGRPRKQLRDIHEGDRFASPHPRLQMTAAVGVDSAAAAAATAAFRSQFYESPHSLYGATVDKRALAGRPAYHPYDQIYSWFNRNQQRLGGLKPFAFPTYNAAGQPSAYLSQQSQIYASYYQQLQYAREYRAGVRHGSFTSGSESDCSVSDPSPEDAECLSGGKATMMTAVRAVVSPGYISQRIPSSHNKLFASKDLHSVEHPQLSIRQSQSPQPVDMSTAKNGSSNKDGGQRKQMSAPECQSFFDLSCAFPSDYWLGAMTESHDTAARWTQKQKTTTEQIVLAYLGFVGDLCGGSDDTASISSESSSDSATSKLPDEELKTRIVKSMSHVISFIRSLPGFSIVDSHDQYVIFRLGWIQVMGLVAALNLYDAEAHRFSKDIVDQSLPAPNPLGRFSDSLLDYAQKIHALRLNTIEAALVTSLVVMATDWPELTAPHVLEESHNHLVATLQAYVTAQYGVGNKRMRDIFRHIPKLRELGLWHYSITLQMWVSVD
ncbi:hypothetical protein LSAT2_007485 [Lamellibrachia satsuma]|nr:hypothetical protein LSAT2_007485 [Lamellibrachia satsuma]